MQTRPIDRSAQRPVLRVADLDRVAGHRPAAEDEAAARSARRPSAVGRHRAPLDLERPPATDHVDAARPGRAARRSPPGSPRPARSWAGRRWRRSPTAAKRSANSASTLARIISPPMPATRQRDRSRPSGMPDLRAARAELVAEGRPERDRAAEVRQQLQPQQRPPGERRARQVVDGDLRHHRRQAAADQAHVVIERQPGGAAVVGAQVQAMHGDRAGVGGDRPLGHQHAAREAGAAGGILDVAGLVGAERLHRLGRRGPARDLGGGGDAGDLGASAPPRPAWPAGRPAPRRAGRRPPTSMPRSRST